MFAATEELNRRELLAALPAGRGGHLGTHTGEFTLRMAHRLGAERVSGVELIPAHAAVARERSIDVAEADLDEGLPFADASFDVVTANQVLEHVRRTDRFLAETRRVLRPGGLACISTNNAASGHNVVSLALGYQPPPMHVSDEVIVGNPLNPEAGAEHEDLGRTHLRTFTGRALAELARHHGLESIVERTVGYYPLPPRPARFCGAARPAARSLPTQLVPATMRLESSPGGGNLVVRVSPWITPGVIAVCCQAVQHRGATLRLCLPRVTG